MTSRLDPDRRRPDDLVPAIECLTSAIQALTAQLSGSVSTASPGASPDPDPKSPPTPLPGDHSRGGVGGSNQPTQAGAGTPPSDATSPPGFRPPDPGGTQRSRPGQGNRHAGPGGPGREPSSDEEADQRACEAWLNEQAARP